MKIEIEYEASWRNSFLDGNNDEALPKNGRKYIASSTNLKNSENYIKREVTLNTVMGLLNRLIGDQRKLYQARNDSEYYFDGIEDENGNYEVVDKDEIWLVVEYTRYAYVWLCPMHRLACKTFWE